MTKQRIPIDEILSIKIPHGVAICPVCGESISIADITEWEYDGDGNKYPTEKGILLECSVDNEHGYNYFVGLSALDEPVCRWLRAKIVFTEPMVVTLEKLRRWNAGEGIKA